jgi:hypothetical protein
MFKRILVTLFFTLGCISPSLATTKTVETFKTEVNTKFPLLSRTTVTSAAINPFLINIADSFIPLLNTKSNCFWRSNGPRTPASCELIGLDGVDSTYLGFTNQSNVWSGTQSFANMPILGACNNGYVRGNGSSAAFCDATIQSSSIPTTFARKDQVNTFDLKQTFSVAPRFSSLNGYLRANGSGADVSTFSSISASEVTYTAPGTGAVSRTAYDRFRDTVNVFDYLSDAEKFDVRSGARTINLYTSLKKADDALGTNGGDLIFPAGVYRWDSFFDLSASGNRHVRCEKGAIFKPVYRFTLIGNSKYKTSNLGTDYTVPSNATQTERHYSVTGCTFDFTAITKDPSPSPVPTSGDSANGVRFYLAQDVDVRDNYMLSRDTPLLDGSTWYGFAAGASCVGSKFCTFENNRLESIHDGIDVWGGTNFVSIRNNTQTIENNETAHHGNGYCVGVNAVGTPADAAPGLNHHLTAESIEVSGNKCVTGGWTSCIQFDPLSPGSKIKNIKVNNNVCQTRAGTTNNTGIYGRGQIEDAQLDGNTISGFNSTTLQVSDMFSSGGPWTCTDCLSTTNGSASVTIGVTSPLLYGSKVVVGNYVLFSSGTADVAGITFASKYFLVTAVNPGVSVTVTADATANATTSGGGSVSMNIWWGAPNGVKITNTSFINSSWASNGLLTAVGTNVTVGGTSAVGGTYGSIVFASSFFRGQNNSPYASVYGTQGSAGSGIAGTSGDGIDNYASTRHPRTRFPAIVLACGSAPSSSVMENGLLWCNTTLNIQARINDTTVTFADLESVQTFTGQKSFNYGTLTASTPTSDSQTWNNASIAFKARSTNVTDTASNSESRLSEWLLGGSDRVYIRKDGRVFSISGFHAISNTGLLAIGATTDTLLTRKGAANWRLGASDAASPVAQTLSVQSVVAGTSNTAGTDTKIEGSQGTGTGAGGSIIFRTAPAGTSGTSQNALADAFSIESAGNIRMLKAFTVATLPAAGTVGRIARVTDGDASLAWGATVVNSGSGTTPYLVWDNGTNWTVTGK